MYSQGLGVDEDEVETVKWYKLAAKQDYAKEGTRHVRVSILS